MTASTASGFDDEIDTLTPAEQRAYLSSIIASTQRPAMIVDHLLNLAQLESGHLPIKPASTDPRLIVDGGFEAIRPQPVPPRRCSARFPAPGWALSSLAPSSRGTTAASSWLTAAARAPPS